MMLKIKKLAREEKNLSNEEKETLEKEIEQEKEKLREIIKTEEKEKQEEKEERKQQHAAATASAPQQQFTLKSGESISKIVELTLYDIGTKLHQFTAIIKTLQVRISHILMFDFQKFGKVSDFKFTDEQKKTALVRYMNAQLTTVLEALSKEGSSQTDSELSFKVKQKEAVEIAPSKSS